MMPRLCRAAGCDGDATRYARDHGAILDRVCEGCFRVLVRHQPAEAALYSEPRK